MHVQYCERGRGVELTKPLGIYLEYYYCSAPQHFSNVIMRLFIFCVEIIRCSTRVIHDVLGLYLLRILRSRRRNSLGRIGTPGKTVTVWTHLYT